MLTQRKDYPLESEQGNGDQRRLAFPTQDGWIFVSQSVIRYIAADGNYVRIHLTDGKKILVSRNLSIIEQQLADANHFFRIHRSFLLNMDFLIQYFRGRQGILLLDDGTRLPLAAHRREAFDEALPRWFLY